MIGKFDKPLPKRLKRAMLAFKTLIGAIAVSQYVTDNPKFSFYALIAGAVVDFIVEALFGDESNG